MNIENHGSGIVPKVLVVDDRKANIIAMKKALSSLPIEFYQAMSGEEALSMVLDHNFAVVLLDVQMPNMDGFEVASLMQSNKKTESIPIIFVTANNREDLHVKKAHEIGAVDYLFKPIDPTILISKVAVFCKLSNRENLLKHLLSENEKIKEQLENSNKKLKYTSNFDLLTKLPNRLQFEENLKKVMSSAKRHQRKFALMFLDLDNFKSTNDTHGHHVGDVLLQEIAEKLNNCFRKDDYISMSNKHDLIARLGGDEFAIILNDLNKTDDARIVAKRAIKEISGLYHIEGIEIQSGVSIGIAGYPESGTDIETLYKNADAAMYIAKSKGKNSFEFYSDNLNHEHLRRLEIENHLAQAVEKNELELYYQPIFCLKGKHLIGLEALIRWKSDMIGVVTPDEFIPIAEGSGLILNISEWILNEAFNQQNEWHKKGYKDHFIAINLSSKQFLNDDIFKSIMSLVKEKKTIIDTIHFELTETAMMVDLVSSEDALKKLKNEGFSLAIDDFGTGSSSLLRLKKLPIDTIKIDKSFISKLNEDEVNSNICKSIIGLAGSLELDVIAEGIETKEELECLIDLGCKDGQGYYLSKPMNVENITKYLKPSKKE